MDSFTPFLLPDLDSAEVIQSKDMRFKKYAHIEYIIKADGSYVRVCRPFGEWPIFYIPIKTLDQEYLKDLEIIKKSQRVLFPGYHENMDPNDARDNEWVMKHCFAGEKLNPQEVES